MYVAPVVAPLPVVVHSVDVFTEATVIVVATVSRAPAGLSCPVIVLLKFVLARSMCTIVPVTHTSVPGSTVHLVPTDANDSHSSVLCHPTTGSRTLSLSVVTTLLTSVHISPRSVDGIACRRSHLSIPSVTVHPLTTTGGAGHEMSYLSSESASLLLRVVMVALRPARSISPPI